MKSAWLRMLAAMQSSLHCSEFDLQLYLHYSPSEIHAMLSDVQHIRYPGQYAVEKNLRTLNHTNLQL